MSRTRLLLISAIGILIVFAVACGTALESIGGGDAPAPPGGIQDGQESRLSSEADDAEFNASVIADEALGSSGARADGSVPGEAPSADLQLGNVLDRKIIQSSSVDIEVEEVGRSFQEIIRITETAGGFVASSSFSNLDDEQIADLTIRVPGESYQDVLAQIRGMGDVSREGSDANDVTEEYTDLQARLRTLEATEGRYLQLLGQANSISDILLVQDRLDQVRGQIEQVQGRINLLEHLTDLATITVHLRPPAPVVEPPADGGNLSPLAAAADAWGASLTALRGLATGVLVAAAFSWWLLPPLAALGFGARWWLQRRPRSAVQTHA